MATSKHFLLAVSQGAVSNIRLYVGNTRRCALTALRGVSGTTGLKFMRTFLLPTSMR